MKIEQIIIGIKNDNEFGPTIIIGAGGIYTELFKDTTTLLLPLNKIWMKFGLILGKIVSPIVMGFIFFFVVTPTGIIMRILGKNLLSLKKNNVSTYWKIKDNKNNNMKNQF